MKERIVSGIQPSGEMHIGNYLGALKDFVQLQDKYECYFFIADLHSITEDYKPEDKRQQILNTLASFIAVGLDPEKSTIFIQSQLPAHSELAWIFNTITPMGELERMTQYKDKAVRQKANINVGLFDYPVLQAADILLYKPAYVPVGQDQVQHLEMTNTIARKFNNKFGQTFNVIKPYIKNPLKIMSLTDPEKKMSKSEPSGALNIFDEPDVIQKKLAKAVTATDAPAGEIPKGIQNLFVLLSEVADKSTYDKYNQMYSDGTIKYSELKKELANSFGDFFAAARKKRNELLDNSDKLTKIAEQGAKKASLIADATLKEVKTKIGLI